MPFFNIWCRWIAIGGTWYQQWEGYGYEFKKKSGLLGEEITGQLDVGVVDVSYIVVIHLRQDFVFSSFLQFHLT